MVTVTRDALIEFVRNALGGGDEGVVVAANPVVDPSATVTDPINPAQVPQDKVEFEVAVKNLVKNIPDEQIANIYKALQKSIEDSCEAENGRSPEETEGVKIQKVEEAVRAAVRKLLREKFSKLQERIDDADLDADAEEVEIEKAKSKKVDNSSVTHFADMDRKLGPRPATAYDKGGEPGVHNVRQEYQRAIKKARWLAMLGPAKRKAFINKARRDYIDMLMQPEKEDELRDAIDSILKSNYIDLLASSGELEPADVQDLKDNPDMVADLEGFKEYKDGFDATAQSLEDLLDEHPDAVEGTPGFRNYLHTVIKQASKGQLDDLRDVEIDGDEVIKHKPKPTAPAAPASADGSAPPPTSKKATYRIYGRRQGAPVHTRFKGTAFAPTGDTKFKDGSQAAISLGADGKLKVTDPETGHTQFWESVGRLTLKEMYEERLNEGK